VEGSLSLITYANRITILDKYFPKSAINLSPYIPIVWPYAPKALTASLSTGLNTVFIEVVSSLNPNQAIGSLEISKLIFSMGLLESLSLYIDLISYLSSKANIIDINLLDAVKQSPFIRRLILNNLV
jgi:hypothetical protein